MTKYRLRKDWNDSYWVEFECALPIDGYADWATVANGIIGPVEDEYEARDRFNAFLDKKRRKKIIYTIAEGEV
jgi:hypothetical protein